MKILYLQLIQTAEKCHGFCPPPHSPINLKIYQHFVGTKFLNLWGDKALWGESKLYGEAIFITRITLFHFVKNSQQPEISSNLLKKPIRKTSRLRFLSFHLQVCLSMHDLLLLHNMNGLIILFLLQEH